MTEVWTGRKYRGAFSGYTYHVIAEPLSWGDEQYVPYAIDGSGFKPEFELLRNFENGTVYTRVIEPKYAIGDKVIDSFGDHLEIDGVSKSPGSGGHFVYLVRESDGGAYGLSENCIKGKVGE